MHRYSACVVRNPVLRFISAWKSKLACGGPNGNADAPNAKRLFGTSVGYPWTLHAISHKVRKYFHGPIDITALLTDSAKRFALFASEHTEIFTDRLDQLRIKLNVTHCLQFMDAIEFLEPFLVNGTYTRVHGTFAHDFTKH